MGTAWFFSIFPLYTECALPCAYKTTLLLLFFKHSILIGREQCAAAHADVLPGRERAALRCRAGVAGEGQLPRHSGVGSGSCHCKGRGLLRHKEGFDRERQSWSESRPWAGSQRAPRPRPPRWEGVPSTHLQISKALLGNEMLHMFCHYRILRGVIFKEVNRVRHVLTAVPHYVKFLCKFFPFSGNLWFWLMQQWQQLIRFSVDLPTVCVHLNIFQCIFTF